MAAAASGTPAPGLRAKPDGTARPLDDEDR